jgi:pantothenate kinase type III
MILTIDIGNTNQTYFLTHLEEEILRGELDSLNSDLELNKIQLNKVKTFVSSVKDPKLSKIDIPNSLIRDYLVHSNFLGMPVHYSQTIGDDRLIAAFYFFKTSKKKQLLIDSGSFTTIDLVDKKGFHGGFILPGWNKIKDCYLEGENLKSTAITLIKPNCFKSPPNNTEDAIKQGALLTFLAPIKQALESLAPEVILVSGGNQQIISEYLESLDLNIPIKKVNNIVHLGLQLLGKERQL